MLPTDVITTRSSASNPAPAHVQKNQQPAAGSTGLVKNVTGWLFKRKDGNSTTSQTTGKNLAVTVTTVSAKENALKAQLDSVTGKIAALEQKHEEDYFDEIDSDDEDLTVPQEKEYAEWKKLKKEKTTLTEKLGDLEDSLISQGIQKVNKVNEVRKIETKPAKKVEPKKVEISAKEKRKQEILGLLASYDKQLAENKTHITEIQNDLQEKGLDREDKAELLQDLKDTQDETKDLERKQVEFTKLLQQYM